MTHLKSLRSIALVLALSSPFFGAVASAQDTSTTPSDPNAPAADAPAAQAEATTEQATTEAATTEAGTTEQATTEQAVTTAAPAPDAQGTEASQLAAPSGQSDPAATTGQSATDQTQATPAASEDEGSAAEAQAAAEPLAWRNTFFSWTQGVTFNTFLRDSQLSYNPTYYHWFFINPRWYLDAQTFFVLGASGYIEVTDDDSSAYNHEFQLGDMTVELRRTIPWEGFVFIPSGRLTFPVSKISQGAQRYFNTGVGLTVVRPIPEALGMTLAASFAYRRWWAGSATTQFQGQCTTAANPLASTGEGELATRFSQLPDGTCQGASANEADRIIASLTINITPFEGFTISLSGAWVWSQAFRLGAYDLSTTGAIVERSVGGIYNDTSNHWRNFTSYSLFVAYDITPWFNLSVGVANSTNLAPLYNDDGSVRSPFNPDTQVNLTAQFTLDGIYEELFGGEEDDGLTPEERQRRRQGLAENGSEEEQQPPTGASRSTTTF